MACLETQPHLYSKWCNKSLKDKFKIDSEQQDQSTAMSSAVPPVECCGLSEGHKKVLNLKNFISQDPQAADFKWSLFVAACHTYRHNTCLKPFPPMYTKNECKDIEALREAIEIIPPLAIMFERLDDPKVYDEHQAAIDLLHWVFIGLRDPNIKSVNKDSFDSILNKVPSQLTVKKPNLIFQLVYPSESSREERWQNVMRGHSTFHAYHGSRLDNFHSIIHYGIQQHMSQNGLFGKGIYLSSELEVSLHWAHSGYGWGGSMLGRELSCVALCELVDHPDVKKGDTEEPSNSLKIAVGKKVPNKYYLALNSDLVRIRYILVYSKDLCAIRHSEINGVVGWFKQNKLLTLLLGYVVLLVSVGLSHNKNVERYYKLFIKKIGFD
ncbi:protein mono-ADP-ribosyltransferase PARP16 isoform X1 [Cotesia glomerata]|uniref:protein mono-ADP-ribosyltransferase PARP16 isoform X1 n=1 Tax=Cotesia glomerata TaxID=32391 RepID=UPI001D01124A|nr:protein mono-ADP-ribosyltransferase PARP16 isoform X1 [Cotesia glomerata]XP_044577190.1 protein mono-ADP-ribosyltransferase PARP16 isoform X1 [Cotesia glomerata]XP_044577191.1 protein mono-ADP-ribosyltransferase PARP16 isoform X1 [Cotesia glomerata]